MPVSLFISNRGRVYTRHRSDGEFRFYVRAMGWCDLYSRPHHNNHYLSISGHGWPGRTPSSTWITRPPWLVQWSLGASFRREGSRGKPLSELTKIVDTDRRQRYCYVYSTRQYTPDKIQFREIVRCVHYCCRYLMWSDISFHAGS